MHADVNEPLPPTDTVLSGMDEDFHPEGGSSEGMLAALPTYSPNFVVHASVA